MVLPGLPWLPSLVRAQASQLCTPAGPRLPHLATKLQRPCKQPPHFTQGPRTPSQDLHTTMQGPCDRSVCSEAGTACFLPGTGGLIPHLAPGKPAGCSLGKVNIQMMLQGHVLRCVGNKATVLLALPAGEMSHSLHVGVNTSLHIVYCHGQHIGVRAFCMKS